MGIDPEYDGLDNDHDRFALFSELLGENVGTHPSCCNHIQVISTFRRMESSCANLVRDTKYGRCCEDGAYQTNCESESGSISVCRRVRVYGMDVRIRHLVSNSFHFNPSIDQNHQGAGRCFLESSNRVE